MSDAYVSASYTGQNGHSASEENFEDDEREALTRLWVEDQIRDRRLGSTKSFTKEGVLENRRLGNRTAGTSSSRPLEGDRFSPQDERKLQRICISREHRRSREYGSEKNDWEEDPADNDVLTDLSEAMLRQKIQDLQAAREALHLPIIARSPFTSPVASPALSPRNSFVNGTDASPLSSPGNSPQVSPRVRLNNSLPRNFRDQFVRETQSLPGSPLIRRSVARQSDLIDETPLGSHHSNKWRPEQGRIEVVNGTHPNASPPSRIGLTLRDSLTTNRLSSNGVRTNAKRPGTPVARDLRPGLAVGQLSRSLSDLNCIKETTSDKREKRIRPLLLPSIGN